MHGKLRAVGLDLSGSEDRPSGWCVIGEARLVQVSTLRKNYEILREIRATMPDVIAIDAPLTRPANFGFRKVDLLLMKRGGRPLPPLMPGMRRLTLRAIKLASEIRKEGFNVIETHPDTIAKILGVKRDLMSIVNFFARNNFTVPKESLTKHELDAMLAALTAYLYLVGEADVLKTEDGAVVIPAEGGKQFER